MGSVLTKICVRAPSVLNPLSWLLSQKMEGDFYTLSAKYAYFHNAQHNRTIVGRIRCLPAVVIDVMMEIQFENSRISVSI
jgi:hypothetical protein